jgi:hypothetical protein
MPSAAKIKMNIEFILSLLCKRDSTSLSNQRPVLANGYDFASTTSFLGSVPRFRHVVIAAIFFSQLPRPVIAHSKDNLESWIVTFGAS